MQGKTNSQTSQHRFVDVNLKDGRIPGDQFRSRSVLRVWFQQQQQQQKPINIASIKGNSWHPHTVVGLRSPEHRKDICYSAHHTSICLPQTCTVDAKRPNAEMKSKLLEEKIDILNKRFKHANDWDIRILCMRGFTLQLSHIWSILSVLF